MILKVKKHSQVNHRILILGNYWGQQNNFRTPQVPTNFKICNIFKNFVERKTLKHLLNDENVHKQVKSLLDSRKITFKPLRKQLAMIERVDSCTTYLIMNFISFLFTIFNIIVWMIFFGQLNVGTPIYKKINNQIPSSKQTKHTYICTVLVLFGLNLTEIHNIGIFTKRCLSRIKTNMIKNKREPT